MQKTTPDCGLEPHEKTPSERFWQIVSGASLITLSILAAITIESTHVTKATATFGTLQATPSVPAGAG